MRANFGLNLAAGNGIDTEIGGILNSEYLASDFWLCQELRKSRSLSDSRFSDCLQVVVKMSSS